MNTSTSEYSRKRLVQLVGGKPREYDVTMLEPGNNWEADSFEHWLKIVEASI